MSHKIELRNVCKSFGDKQVLKGITADIKEGETFVIIGGSGSGKSVLLKCILGLLNPTEGTIRIDGEDTTEFNNKQRMQLMTKFGMLFQSGALFDSMTIWENVAFGLLQNGESPRRAKETAISKLGLVGLEPRVADLNPSELSGGMRKRAGLARAICMDPEIVFYDEPTTGLDPITSDVINDLILKLQKELGVTSIMITHNMKSAFKVASSMHFLYQGKFIAHGTPEEIQTSDNPYVVQFINGRADGPIKMAVTKD